MKGKRIYNVKEDYFETWSHEMAYILGFISADGSVYKNTLSIELQTRDIEILEFIKQQISPTSPIKITKKKNTEYCLLRLNSTKMIKSLEKYNVIPNKTFSIRFNFDIPQQFLWDYVRGIFDGDGWVTCRRNTVEFGVCSASESFLKDLQSKINFGRISCHSSIKNNTKSIAYYLECESKSAIAIRDLMYSSNTFSLKRKKEKFYSEFFKPSSRWWTEEQINYLKDNYIPNQSPQFLADKLGKSYKAISCKIWELKLTSQNEPSKLDEVHR